MIPIRDSIPRVHTPYVVYTIIAVNLLIFLFQQTLSDVQTLNLFHLFGVVPARFAFPEWALRAGYPHSGAYAFVTHLFLHGGWLHFVMNMWSLWIFADNIEDVMGPWRFLLFYITCGLAAVLVHLFFHPGATVPIVGASGAISGVMGAYFLLYPHAKVTTLIPIIIIPLFFDIPAALYLGVWFASQLISGTSALTSGAGTDIAWWAHAGGFLAGMILLPLFRRKGHCYYCRIPDGETPHKANIERPDTSYDAKTQTDAGSDSYLADHRKGPQAQSRDNLHDKNTYSSVQTSHHRFGKNISNSASRHTRLSEDKATQQQANHHSGFSITSRNTSGADTSNTDTASNNTSNEDESTDHKRIQPK